MTDLEELKKLAEAAPVARVRSKWGDPEAFGEREIEADDNAMQKLRYGSPLYADDPAARSALPALIERVEAAEAENARLREMVDRFCNIMQHCTVTDGSCCCGEDMANHSAYSGHAPTDHGSRVADRALEDALELLGRQS